MGGANAAHHPCKINPQPKHEFIGNALIMKGEKRETDLRGEPLPNLKKEGEEEPKDV